MQVIVCGGRDANQPDVVWSWLDVWLNRKSLKATDIILMVEDMSGVAAFAKEWAEVHGVRVIVGPYDWKAATHLIAFPGSWGPTLLKAKDHRVSVAIARQVIYKNTNGGL